MKNNFFEATYDKVQALHKAYEAATDKTGKAAIQDSYKALMEEIEVLGAAACRIWREYKISRDCGNEYLDISDVVWDKDVEGLIFCMREHGIKKFTFSSCWSSAVETAWLFQKADCKLEGLIEINSQHKEIMSDEYEKAHGYLFSIG